MKRLIASLSALAALTGCPATTTVDAGADTPSALDTPGLVDVPSVVDAPGLTDVLVALDTAGLDAGPACGGNMRGFCAGGSTCECCPAGGPSENCVCTDSCRTLEDCPAERPVCQIEPGSMTGFCAPASLTCCWGCL